MTLNLLSESCFNPRSHVGSDARPPGHAAQREGFNPRSHVGSDDTSSFRRSAILSFNPRSHVGSDPSQTSCEPKGQFQSTLPRGERLSKGMEIYDLKQFQSTLPRGERQIGEGDNSSSHMFQSTLPRGERQQHPHGLSGYASFNPRSHVGSDIIWAAK